MLRFLKPITALASSCLLLALAVPGCTDDVESKAPKGLGFDRFVEVYNRSVDEWLANQIKDTEKQIAAAQTKLAETEDEAKQASIQANIKAATELLESFKFRQELDGYFSFKDENSIPDNLIWNDGMDQPEIGDPRATKGGTFRYYIPSFPPTARRFGPKSNHSFRGRMYDDIEMPLVNLHPITAQYIPGVANRWAISADRRTVFYEIDPNAKWNDGTPVKATDYMWGIYVRVSDYVSDPYYKQYLREEIANVTVYSDRKLSVTVPSPKPMMPLYASVIPAPQEFYSDYGPDYTERYQWKPQPIIGAYRVEEDGLKKGLSITLTRDKDFWAKDHKYYKNLYNPDRIVYSLVRNTSKALEMFRAGDLDYQVLNKPDTWYRKTEIPPVFDGYIQRYTFYNQYPRPPYGLYINVTKPLLNDQNIREGICYSCNWQKIIDAIFQGDYGRLENFSEGFGAFTNPDVRSRRFSISKAQECFAKAGFTEKGEDGILRRPDGTKLSISITHYSIPTYVQMVAILIEEAKKVGLELRSDSLEPNVAFKKTSDKLHDICFTAWAVSPPFPRYYQFFHSSNALTEEGLPKPDTNNINCYANPRMDRIAETMRSAKTLEELRQACFEGQELIHNEAIFVPGYVTDFVRCGTWRWVRWPDTKLMPFSPPIVYEPLDNYAFWIDQEMKQDTLKAMREGRTFPEVQMSIDHFRDWQQPITTPLPVPEAVPTASDASPSQSDSSATPASAQPQP